MTTFIVSLVSDGESKTVEIEADHANKTPDNGLEFISEHGMQVSEFSLWAWYSRKENAESYQ